MGLEQLFIFLTGFLVLNFSQIYFLLPEKLNEDVFTSNNQDLEP